MTYFRRIRENIVLAVEKYWTRLRLVQYFSTARTIFPRIRLKAIQYYVNMLYLPIKQCLTLYKLYAEQLKTLISHDNFDTL